MKKLIIPLILCLMLSACGYVKYGADDAKAEENDTAIDEDYKAAVERAKILSENFDSEKGLTAAQKKLLAEEYEKVDGIKFIQHSNGRDVKVYRHKDEPSIYLLYDGFWLTCVKGTYTMPGECSDMYDMLEDTGFKPFDWNRGLNGKGVVICENTEFTVADFNGYTLFSVNYPDVDIEIENMPMKALIYEDGGRTERVEFVIASSRYMEELSQKNIDDAAELLTKTGFGERSRELAEEMAQSLDKAGYKRDDGDVSVRSTRDAYVGETAAYNLFTVSKN